MGLKLYNKKRDFNKTREPKGKSHATQKHRFVVQEHHATRLHFDFRLEMDGVMKSWAVPKGPSMNPGDKRLAMMVEDHPIDYMYFEGAIPIGEYGGGEVRRWDIGTYEAVGDIPILEQLHRGKLTFIMHGKRLQGEFHLIHMHADEPNAWLLRKTEDEFSDRSWTMEQILDYGSRFDAPGARNGKDGKNGKTGALKKAVARTAAKQAAEKRTGAKKTAAKKATTKRASAKRSTARSAEEVSDSTTGRKASRAASRRRTTPASAKNTAPKRRATAKTTAKASSSRSKATKAKTRATAGAKTSSRSSTAAAKPRSTRSKAASRKTTSTRARK